MVKAYVVYGLGIGCHKEVAHAFEYAGADAELVHIRQLLSGEKRIFDAQIINLSGGFLHGDIHEAGMCAATELEHAVIKLDEEDEKKVKDVLIEFAEKGNVIYGQCNGFQLLVKTGLLPGIDNDYSQQTVTLTYNNCGNYRVAPVLHGVMKNHFAFDGVTDSDLYLWCRHGEGRMLFHTPHGLVSEEEGESNREKVNADHVLLRYLDPNTMLPTEDFPHNPNGSVDGIAGLVDSTGRIIGHMAHTEVSLYPSRDPRWFFMVDELRRQGVPLDELDKLEGAGAKVFRNIVGYFK